MFLVLALAAAPFAASASEVVSDSVVLLHGLGRGPWGLKILEWRLERAGYQVYGLRYDARSASIELAAASVYEQVHDCCAGAARVHFVTHSLGGLVLRSLLSEHLVPNAGRAVLLAPPNGGSQIVDRFADQAWFRLALGPLAPRLGTGPEGIPRSLPPPSIPFGVIAGSRWWNPLGAVLLPGPHDGTLSVEATRLEGMADHLVVPHSHTFIMNSSRVAEEVQTFLRTGRFSEVPPPGAAQGG